MIYINDCSLNYLQFSDKRPRLWPAMKVNVKILQGAECNVDIISADSVDHLKQLVQVGLLPYKSHS